MAWSIRRLQPDDEAKFVPFLGRWIFDRPVNVHFDWLYRNNPHGNAITWIAVQDKDSRIIGCTSTFPRRMMLDGKKVIGSFGGDAFVDPEFRRRGIAQSLHEYGAEDMRKLNIECLYGFPVPANFRAFIRAGALDPCDFHRFWIPLSAARIVKSIPLGSLSGLVEAALNPFIKLHLNYKLYRKTFSTFDLEAIESFDSNVDSLFETVSGRLGICCVRDSAYLNWRFCNHPFIEYTIVKWQIGDQLNGYAVLDMRAERCQIVDFLVRDSEKVATDFLASLARFAGDRDKWSVVLNLNSRGPEAQIFASSGFRRLGKGHRLMVHTTGHPENDLIFNNARLWFLMPGDRDTG